jgi:predicted extracellular nuclease
LYDAGLFNVYDQIVEQQPANAYSYIYRGIPNVLDHFFLSPAAKARLGFSAYMKLNASAPEAFPNQPPLRASDHDPLMILLTPPTMHDGSTDGDS